MFLFSAMIVNGQVSTAIVSGQVITVSEARNLPNDSWVILSGNIINALIGSNNYVFRDDTGEIIIDIEQRVWRGLYVGVSDRVVISGEIIINRGLVSLKARAISGSSQVHVMPGQALMINQPLAINEARNLPHDSWVILRGNIVGALPGGRNYTFRDSSGEIIIDIERRVWRGLTVGVSDRVEISGEIRINRGQVSLVARAIRGI